MREERIGNARLILGDCQDVLPTLTGVDHVISDPPYEDELHAAIGTKRNTRTDGREMIAPLSFAGINTNREKIAGIVTASSSVWAVLFTLAEGVRAWRDALQATGAKYDTCLAWIKPDSMPRFNGQGAARGFECVVTAWCGRGHKSWNGGGRRGVFTHCVNTNRYGAHPTEKPLPLMRDLVSLYSNFAQTVLDPFMGSGTTGVACARLGRKFIGVEIDETYFNIACRRVEDAYRQPDMFVPRPSGELDAAYQRSMFD